MAARKSTRAFASTAGRSPTCSSAFDIEDYPVSGQLSGDFHVYGPYTRPFGVGHMSIDDGTAFGEPFRPRRRRASFRGQRRSPEPARNQQRRRRDHRCGLCRLEWHVIRSTPTAAASPVETLDFTVDAEPAAAHRHCSTSRPPATRRSTQPRYDVSVGVHDLFFGEEGIGQVTGRLSVRDTLLTYELEAASPRLAFPARVASRSMRQAMRKCRFASPTRRSIRTCERFSRRFRPYATATASGTIRVVGELYNRDALRIEASVDNLDLAAARLPAA